MKTAITRPTQLASVKAVAKHIGIGRNWLYSAKKFGVLAGDSFMRGGKTSEKLVLAWLDRHPDFSPGITPLPPRIPRAE